VRAGERLRLVLRSHDDGRTIETFDEGAHAVLRGGGNANVVELPLRPAALQGVRLA